MNAFNLIYSNPKLKIDFPKLSQTILKRSLNQDTNAADPFQPIVEKSAETALDEDNDPKQKKKNPTSNGQKTKRPILSPRVMDAVLTTVMGLAAVDLFRYEWNEVHKVKMAFKKSLTTLRVLDVFEERNEYQTISDAIKGNVRGKYFLLVGERGTGKTQLIFHAMKENNQKDVVFAEAHSDSEIFKCRLGKALQYTYREDYIGQLFAREAPERGSALLDVEKALNMVEIVAKKRFKKNKEEKPLVLVISNIHAFKDDEDGEDLLELLQQRAESWAASKMVTMVFNTDDYTIYERMNASRMEVIRVRELKDEEAANLLIKLIEIHKKNKQENQKKNKQKEEKEEKVSEDKLREIVERIGGRLSYITKLARADDIQKDEERNWIINRIGLIPNFEESAFDDQKYASCAWKLIRKIVKSGDKSVSVEEGREITGNPKWIEMMDHDNIIMIDENQKIKADSKMLQKIFDKIVNEDGFDERLDNVCERVEEVDKEQRTRELIWSKKNDQVVRIGKPKKSLTLEKQSDIYI
ncbi:7748_t:CDS:2 [Racocetra fulgida]|uniref:7748_t:CDS:1 n=1 Tax=Racocetra fulgida TaxID=60492 RepID=A0A9N8WCF8_9GLOM|nr:7748_t:CDS:2 [Racocetra fulgida]